MKKTKFKNQKAITLIALVITIIVMLILTGVGIAMLTGENGVLKQATDAKKATTEAEVKEEAELAYQAVLTQLHSEQITESEAASKLGEELKTTVTDNGAGYSFSHKGYNVTILKSTGRASVSNEEEPVSDIKWIYSENEDGNIEITGIDLRDYELTDTGDGYSLSISLGLDTLYIPSKIDNKTVVKVSFENLGDTIEMSVKNTDVKKISYGNSIQEIDRGHLYFEGVEEIELPDNLKVIGDNAFEGYGIKRLDIPEGVTDIGKYVFIQCLNLTNITIPSSVMTIGDWAFMGAPEAKIHFSNGLNENLVIDNYKWGAEKAITTSVPIKFTLVPAGRSNGYTETITYEMNEVQTWGEWIINNKDSIKEGVGKDLIDITISFHGEIIEGEISGSDLFTRGYSYDLKDSNGEIVKAENTIQNGKTYYLRID